MVTVTFIGAWGRRAQTYAEIVAAGQSMLTAMPDRPAGRWTRFVEKKNSPLMDAVPVDITDITSLGAAVDLTSGRGDRHQLLVNRQGGPQDYPVRVSVQAGAVDSDNRIIVDIAVPEEDPQLHRLLGEYLRAIVSAWDPDWLKVGTYEFHVVQKQIGLAPKEIILGWQTYIADRVPLEAEVLDGTVPVTRVGEGGRCITLDGTPTEPSLDQALLVRHALGLPTTRT